MASQSTPLAIIGIGCLFPKAHGPGAFWANVKTGVDCVGPVPSTHWKPDDYFDADPKSPDMTYAVRGAFLDAVDFNPLEFGISPIDLEAIDTSQLLGLVAARQALDDAGYGPNRSAAERGRIDKSRISVILGVTGTLELVVPLGARLGHPKWKKALKDAGVDDSVAADVVSRIGEAYVPWQENSFPGLLGNVVAGRIANRLDLGGTNCVVDAACASSLSAIHLAGLELQAGRCDMAVTGGVDTFNDIFMYMCFSKTPALSKSGDARPFESDGDGTILGEGLGIVVLKRLEDARRDGDRVYAVIRSIGSSSDGKGNAVYAPSAEGQTRALNAAYSLADVSPATIELVEAHGTGTKVGDTVEATALAQVYREAGRTGTWCAVGSVKSMVGHTKAAAGAAGLIKAALALHHKVLPPTLKVKQPVEPLRPGKSGLYVNTEMRPWLPNPRHPRRAGLSAFGFGGSNFHAVLEEASPTKSQPDWDGRVEIIPLSGSSRDALSAQVADLRTAAHWAERRRRARQCRSKYRVADPCRLLVVVRREDDWSARLDAADRVLKSPSAVPGKSTDGVFFGEGGPTGSIGILFPGQGSQRIGMLREAVCTFPEMLESWTAAEQAGQDTGPSLLDITYPHGCFTPEQTADAETRLRATEFAQPALGAVEFGAWKLLQRFGIRSAAFAGHSFGELTALAAAGVFSEADLHRLARLRGRLMADAAGPNRGAMSAVHAAPEDIERLIGEDNLSVVLANRNSPSQGVISGSVEEIGRAESALQRRRIRFTRLPVSAAFHSPMVAPAVQSFARAVQEVNFQTGQAPVFANTGGLPYPNNPNNAQSLLAEQLAQPVDFVGMIRNMVRAGVRSFVEVGPGTVLTRLTEGTLSADGVIGTRCVSIDSNGRRPGLVDLAWLLAELSAAGHDVDWSAWQAGAPEEPDAATKPGMTIPICGANYMRPRTEREPVRRTATKPPVMAESAPSTGSVVKVVPVTTSVPAAPVRSGPQPVQSRAQGSVVMSESQPMNRAGQEAPGIANALAVTQQSLAAFQRLQEETARLHKQFLDNQQAALATLQVLVAQQQSILTGIAPTAMPMVSAVPAVPPAVAPVVSAVPTPIPSAPTSVPVYAPVAPPAYAAAPIAAPAVPLSPPSTVATVSPVPTTRSSATPSIGSADKVLLAIVAEKTGYPAEMLGLDMSLDADLGIDSIKRVEILSAVQEKLPDAPTVKPEHLGTLQTLRDVLTFIESERGASSPTSNGPIDAPRTNAMPSPHAPPDTVSLRAASRPLPGDADVGATLLSVVSEKTGYPSDMLALDMALDADLGIDSIKRVEILSTIQERVPNAPVVKPEHLSTLHTLRDVVQFLQGSGGDPPTASPPAPVREDSPPFGSALTPDSDSGERTIFVDAVTAEAAPELPPTNYDDRATTESRRWVAGKSGPIKMIEPASVSSGDSIADGQMHGGLAGAQWDGGHVRRSILKVVQLPAVHGTDRIKVDRFAPVWLIAEPSSLTAKISQQFDAVGLRPQFIPWNDSPFAYDPKGLAGLVLIAPEPPVPEDLALRAFRWLKRSYPGLKESSRRSAAFVSAVTKFDGQFGLGNLDGRRDPIQAALLGLVKTAHHEWPKIACKAIDLDPGYTRNLAPVLVEECLTPGPIEVGLSAGGRFGLEVVETPQVLPAGESLGLDPGAVVVVSGGARGVTCEALFPLVRAVRPKLALLGRTDVPEWEPDWLATLREEGQIKQAILNQSGKTLTPRELAEEYKRIRGQREIRRNLRRLQQAGAEVVYMPVDVQDAGALSAAIADLRRRFGSPSAVIHGAGILADKRIEDLSEDQFNSVFAVKVTGLRNVLAALDEDPLRAIVLFSSSTGRYGRTGQAAYAAGNEVLNKTAQILNRVRPRCRSVAINWGPWAGGMVTPALAAMFEKEGVGLIPYAEGGQILLGEISSSDRPAETVVIATPGGKNVLPVATPSAEPETPTPAPLPPSNNPETNLVFERTITLHDHPVLRSHVLNDQAVLPLVLHLEFMTHAAMHGNPGLRFLGFDDLRVFQAVQLDELNPAHIRVTAAKAVKKGETFVVSTEIRGRRNGRDLLHSRAEIVIGGAPSGEPPMGSAPPETGPFAHSINEIYDYFLFHGPDLRAIDRVDGIGDRGFIGMARTGALPGEWMHAPLRGAWFADPLALDAAFQLMILWTFDRHRSGSLPCYVGNYRQFSRGFAPEGVMITGRITRDNGTIARGTIEFLDQQGRLVARMGDVEHVMDPSLNETFRRGRFAQPTGNSRFGSKAGSRPI